MKIYDRYKPDSSQERRRYEERAGESRERYNRTQTLAAILIAVCIGLAVLLAVYMDSIPAALQTVLGVIWIVNCAAALVAIFRLEKKGDDTEPDLYIYGMKNGRFLVLNQLYETLKHVDPCDVKEIYVLSAMRPLTRQRHFSSRAKRRIENTDYEYFGEKQESGKIKSYPMVVLSAGKKKINWNGRDASVLRWNNVDDPVFRRRLNSLLSFVPMGEREEHFVYLLQKSSCPVVVALKVYKRYREYLDGLFTRSCMDMNRIRIKD